MVSRSVLAHLREEISKPDPWRLGCSPFEQRRYDMLFAMLDESGDATSGLEIGCAAGLFTERLAARCDSLHVVDLLPEAIARCRDRLCDAPHVRYTVADISEPLVFGGPYGVVVISEVLYYLGKRAAMRRAVDAVVRAVAPGGVLLFGSATDVTVRRWGFTCGAETAIAEFSRTLTAVESHSCDGDTLDERALIVRFVNHA